MTDIRRGRDDPSVDRIQKPRRRRASAGVCKESSGRRRRRDNSPDIVAMAVDRDRGPGAGEGGTPDELSIREGEADPGMGSGEGGKAAGVPRDECRLEVRSPGELRCEVRGDSFLLA